MATITLQFVISDTDLERIYTALRKHFGPITEETTEDVTDPVTQEVSQVTTVTTRDMTPMELIAHLRENSINNVKSIVASVEAEEAALAARLSATAVVIE
jgi:hypothetical protein